MGYASRSGRAITNPSAPRAFGVCDRCGIWYNLHQLKYQYEWQGTKLQNLRLRVCYICLDVPQPQLKAKVIPPDPVPVRDPRPEPYLYPSNRSFLVQEQNSLNSIGTETGPGNVDPGVSIPMEIQP